MRQNIVFIENTFENLATKVNTFAWAEVRHAVSKLLIMPEYKIQLAGSSANVTIVKIDLTDLTNEQVTRLNDMVKLDSNLDSWAQISIHHISLI